MENGGYLTVYGNSLDNTIRPSASYGPGARYDQERYCNGNATKILGWLSSWNKSMRIFGFSGHDWIQGCDGCDFLYGCDGNDVVDGALWDMNMVFGEGGFDSLHGSGEDGSCDGGSPSYDYNCFSWSWPFNGVNQGGCCCTNCNDRVNCNMGDTGHGPPDYYTPW
jgi:hypothetical protein